MNIVKFLQWEAVCCKNTRGYMCTIIIGSSYNFRFSSSFCVLCSIKVKLSVKVKLFVSLFCVCAILPAKAVSEMTYTVLGGTLNPTHSLTHLELQGCTASSNIMLLILLLTHGTDWILHEICHAEVVVKIAVPNCLNFNCFNFCMKQRSVSFSFCFCLFCHLKSFNSYSI